MVKRLRVAVVGCGRVSRLAHFPAISSLDVFELSAVCDRRRVVAEACAREFRVPAFDNISDMLEGGGIDIVAINAPNGLHPELAMLAAQAGAHVICEKPLAIDTAQIEPLLKAAQENGVKIFTVLQNRFNPPVILLKKAIRNGRFGRIHTCNATIRWNHTAPYYEGDLWWHGDRQLGRGVFTNQAVHHLDLLEWLVGAAPEIVYARMATAKFPVEVETHGSAIISFRNGVLSTIDVTALSFRKDLEASVTVMGEFGTAKIDGIALNHIAEWDFKHILPEDDAVRESNYDPPNVYGFGHRTFYELVAAAIRGISWHPDLPDGREGRKSAMLLSAIYESDRTGSPVRMPIGMYGQHFPVKP